jgi:hypothetical protein
LLAELDPLAATLERADVARLAALDLCAALVAFGGVRTVTS